MTTTEYIRNDYCRVFWISGIDINYMSMVAIRSVARHDNDKHCTVILETYIDPYNATLMDFIDHVHIASHSAIDVVCSKCSRPDNYHEGVPYMRLSGFELIDKTVPDVTVLGSAERGAAVARITMKCKVHWFREFM